MAIPKRSPKKTRSLEEGGWNLKIHLYPQKTSENEFIP